MGKCIIAPNHLSVHARLTITYVVPEKVGHTSTWNEWIYNSKITEICENGTLLPKILAQFLHTNDYFGFYVKGHSIIYCLEISFLCM